MSRKQILIERIAQALDPIHLEVIDESHMHNVDPDGESHFKLVVVSKAFEGERLINRHRRINELAGDQFPIGLHALALHTLTPDEWFEKGGKATDSPPCRGGSKA